MRRERWRQYGLVLAALYLALGLSLLGERPRLAVIIIVDQFRSDYLTRFSEHFLPARENGKPGGFRALMEEGSYFPEAEYRHLATFTCTGHAAITTGAIPAVNGIIGNVWFDRKLGRLVNCTEDASLDPDLPRLLRSPATLRVSTIGDELKLATAGLGTVIGLSFKDYAILSSVGRMADLALWFDTGEGAWVSNRYFLGDGDVPAWVNALNDRRLPDGYSGKVWNRLLPAEKYRETSTPETAEASFNNRLGWRFPHQLPSLPADRRALYSEFMATGFGNDFLIESALAAVRGAGLGADDVPDLLILSLSSNDYVGHRFGPDSPEVMDVSIRTDRALSRLLGELESMVGREHLVVALSSDHGVQSIPSELSQERASAGRVRGRDIVAAVETELSSRFGGENWAVGLTDTDLYLSREKMLSSGVSAEEIERVAARAAEQIEGIAQAFTRTQVMEGRLPDQPVSQQVSSNFHPGRSGDVILIFDSNWMLSARVITTHGTRYSYNTRVPVLLWGGPIRAGTFWRSVEPRDIAPTLSFLLHTAAPSGSDRRPLFEALKEHSQPFKEHPEP